MKTKTRTTPAAAPQGPQHKSFQEFLSTLDEADTTVAEWARERNLPLSHVYQVLQGRMLGRRGVARQVIKAMGLPLPAARPANDRKASLAA